MSKSLVYFVQMSLSSTTAYVSNALLRSPAHKGTDIEIIIINVIFLIATKENSTKKKKNHFFVDYN